MEDLQPLTEDAGSRFDAVALAASAGGVTALGSLLGGLPPRLPAIVLVVQHVDPRHRSLLPEILGRRSRLAIEHAEDGELLRTGRVYVAPPDRHLLVDPDGRASLTRSELVHFVRPSADLLFESVAARFGARAIGVVLTGTGRDGAMGIEAIKKRGGTTLAQDPSDAEFAGMPNAAVATGCVDHVLALKGLASAIMHLVTKGTLE